MALEALSLNTQRAESLYKITDLKPSCARTCSRNGEREGDGILFVTFPLQNVTELWQHSLRR